MRPDRLAALLSEVILDSLKQTRSDDFDLICDLVGQRLRNFAFNHATRAMLLPPDQKTRPMDRQL